MTEREAFYAQRRFNHLLRLGDMDFFFFFRETGAGDVSAIRATRASGWNPVSYPEDEEIYWVNDIYWLRDDLEAVREPLEKMYPLMKDRFDVDASLVPLAVMDIHEGLAVRQNEPEVEFSSLEGVLRAVLMFATEGKASQIMHEEVAELRDVIESLAWVHDFGSPIDACIDETVSLELMSRFVNGLT